MTDTPSEPYIKETRVIKVWDDNKDCYIPQFKNDNDEWETYIRIDNNSFSSLGDARRYLDVYGSGETIVFAAREGPACRSCGSEIEEGQQSIGVQGVCRDCEMGVRPYGRY